MELSSRDFPNQFCCNTTTSMVHTLRIQLSFKGRPHKVYPDHCRGHVEGVLPSGLDKRDNRASSLIRSMYIYDFTEAFYSIKGLFNKVSFIKMSFLARNNCTKFRKQCYVPFVMCWRSRVMLNAVLAFRKISTHHYGNGGPVVIVPTKLALRPKMWSELFNM